MSKSDPCSPMCPIEYSCPHCNDSRDPVFVRNYLLGIKLKKNLHKLDEDEFYKARNRIKRLLIAQKLKFFQFIVSLSKQFTTDKYYLEYFGPHSKKWIKCHSYGLSIEDAITLLKMLKNEGRDFRIRKRFSRRVLPDEFVIDSSQVKREVEQTAQCNPNLRKVLFSPLKFYMVKQ